MAPPAGRPSFRMSWMCMLIHVPITGADRRGCICVLIHVCIFPAQSGPGPSHERTPQLRSCVFSCSRLIEPDLCVQDLRDVSYLLPLRSLCDVRH
eukprot:3006015-Rhodomonas_salina.4